MIYTFENKQHGHSFNVAYSTILMLSQSQGIYSRLREEMENQNWKPLIELTKDSYFNDELDFVMFIEQ